jgi:hypothetical protein
MSIPSRLCSHCNNTCAYDVVFKATVEKLWEDGSVWMESDDDAWVKGEWLTDYEPYQYCVVQCTVCGHLSLLGEFDPLGNSEIHELAQLYPTSAELSTAVPESIRKTYLEAATIRVRAPHAYAGQIRRALELVCKDKDATGHNLFQQIASLTRMGILPATLAEMTDLIRQIGNASVHSEGQRISVFTTDLIDDFFRAVVEYVYIAPSKIAELKRMLDHETEPPKDLPQGDSDFIF